MRPPPGISLLVALSSLACRPRPVAASARPAPHALVVRGTVTLPDGATLPDAAVLVEGNRIVHGVSDVPVDDAFLALVRERRVPHVTTLVVLEGYAEGLGRRVRLTPAEREVADPAAVASLLDPAPLPERAAGAATRMQAQLPVALANVRRARDAGVLVVAGSDAGTIGTLHGPAVLRELELLVVVLDASPLADVRNLARVRVVVKDGVPHTPEEILAPTPGERARRQENAARLRE